MFFLPLTFGTALSPISATLWIAYSFVATSYFTFLHPFLISDNRHYMFYIWKNFLSDFNFLMFPVYGLAGEYVASFFPSRMRYLIWIFCCAVTLIPAGLLEPRYFILPITMLLLETRPQLSTLRLIALAVLNFALVFVFVKAPYKEIHFMW
jgi:alpha-1,2-glucosyltransferase